MQRRVAIVGAGPAGVAAAVALKDRGIRALVVDQAGEVASSWRSRYDRLRLNTSRLNSHLPGRRFARGTAIFPTRDQLVAHLDRHVRADGIELRLGTRVDRVERQDGGWLLRTDGEDVAAAQVVVATGFEQHSVIPDWAGRDAFAGRLTHSAAYRSPGPFQGERVLVVGPGCSGMEIAYDVAAGGAAKVWLSARTPPNIVLRQGPGPLPGDLLAVPLYHVPPRIGDAAARFGRRMGVGDLTEYGLPVPEEGVFTKVHRNGQAPAIVDLEVIDAIKDGRIEVVRGVESLDQTGVTLADGARVEPDTVICATGYRRALDGLVGHLGVLDADGNPRTVSPKAAAPGLRFGGYVARPGALGFMGKEAKRAARAIERELA